MRLTIADWLYLLFGAICILGIANANRAIIYNPSPIPDCFDYGIVGKQMTLAEHDAWIISGNSDGSQMAFQLLTSDSITRTALLDQWREYAEQTIKEYGFLLSTKRIVSVDHQTTGYALEWESHHNRGLVELVLLDSSPADKIKSKPNWTRQHTFHMRLLEYWHPNAR